MIRPSLQANNSSNLWGNSEPSSEGSNNIMAAILVD